MKTSVRVLSVALSALVLNGLLVTSAYAERETYENERQRAQAEADRKAEVQTFNYLFKQRLNGDAQVTAEVVTDSLLSGSSSLFREKVAVMRNIVGDGSKLTDEQKTSVRILEKSFDTRIEKMMSERSTREWIVMASSTIVGSVGLGLIKANQVEGGNFRGIGQLLGFGVGALKGAIVGALSGVAINLATDGVGYGKVQDKDVELLNENK